METLYTLIPIILLIAVFYFFIIRPQSKQQKELQEMRDSIKAGDEILTIGGFYGIVYAVDDKNIVLEMLPDFNKLMIVKSAVSRVITAEDSVLEAEEEAYDEPALEAEALGEVSEAELQPEESEDMATDEKKSDNKSEAAETAEKEVEPEKGKS